MRRMFWTMWALSALAMGWTACGDDDTGPVCQDSCAAENDTQCQGTVIQRCGLGADGCLAWVSTVDCGDQQQVCDDTASPAVCRLDCLSDCNREGDSQCAGETTQSCETGADGCLHWTDGADCAAMNRICDTATGDATCVRDCSDQCPADGDTQCAGTVVETCSLNAKDCLEWVAGQDCADSGLVCDDSGPDAMCHVDCSIYFPGTPSGPSPADGATDVDPGLTVLDWTDVGDATGYAVYLGACPAPAYPGAGFTQVTDSTLTGASLTMDTTYCWRVVSLDGNDCSTEGAEWSFTTACVDPVAGAPTVTSTDVTLFVGGNASYTLTFSEDVTGVAGGLTLASVSGSGGATLGAVTPVDGATYQVAILGGVAGDVYRLTVATSVVDLCGTPLVAAADVLITLEDPPGTTCADAADLTGATFPVQLPGTYEDDPALVTGCDDTPTNAVWYSYTPTATGLYQIDAANDTTTIAYSRLTVLEGTGCAPYGTEISCQTASDQMISGLVPLTAGVSYLIVFFTDGDSYTMVDPTISISQVTVGPGDYCTDPVDLDSVSLPHALSGTFDLDGQGGSCDISATNMVWYSYTAPSDGVYTLDATNNTTAGASSRLALFDGTGCAPFGAELLCDTASSETISSQVVLSAGQQVRIVYYTSADSDTMEDPEIDIHGRPIMAGEVCDGPIALTGANPSDAASGTFGFDAPGGSCDTTATNVVWYSLTAASDGVYTIDVANNTTTSAGSRLAVFAGLGCGTYGDELLCETASAKTMSSELVLTAGQQVLIAFYTSGDSYTMVDPQIAVTSRPIVSGETCGDPIALTGANPSHAASGTFGLDAPGGSCDTTATNVVWYSLTAASDGVYTIDATNATSTSAYSRLAVFDGLGCGTYGAELLCETATGKTVSTGEIALSAGQQVLVAFYTDGDSYTMVDPEIQVTSRAPLPGETCASAVALTGGSPSHAASGTFDLDGPGGSCDDTATNIFWFTYTASANGVYQIDASNATSTIAYARLAVFDTTACSPRGDELLCRQESATSDSAIVSLSAGQEVLVAFYTDGDSYTMVDPTVSVTPLSPTSGEWCSDPIDVSGQTFPYTATGTFDLDPNSVSCEDRGYNGVWFTYTPTTTGWYAVTGHNGAGNTRVAVFEGAGCGALSTELACQAASGGDPAATVQMTAGTTYLVLFLTDADADAMTNPTLDIAPTTAPPPGMSCDLPAQVGDPIHSVDGSGHDCWQWTEDQSDTTNDHVFTCDGGVGGDVVAAFTAGASQTTLHYSATLTNPDTPADAYVGVEVTESPCSSGTSLDCHTESGGSHSYASSVTVQPGTTYYVWVTDAYSGHYRAQTTLCVW